MTRVILGLIAILLCALGSAQTEESYMDPAVAQEYEIGGITVSGTKTTDANAVRLFTGLQVGDKLTIPGEKITKAITNLWEQKLFSDVSIEAAEIRGRTIFLNIIVVEKPRLSRWKYTGITKNEGEKLDEIHDLLRGQQVNDALISTTSNAIRHYFVDKAFLKAKVTVVELNTDSMLPNSVQLNFVVNKGKKVRIKEVIIEGNELVKTSRLRRAMKKTKQKRWWNPFASSKFDSKEYQADKARLIDVYNEKGFRNATILSDTNYFVSNKRIVVKLNVYEGAMFHFRNITFTGNNKHTSAELASILNINKGEVYNKKLLDSRIYMNPAGGDISSLYMDDGYLSFYPDPVELLVDGDSIDLDIRIREGKQYRIRNVIIKGNTKTNEHVIRREIRTKPGELFNRSYVIRTQRELSQLGYFNPETLGVNPIQDPRTGTVDLEYTVEEKPSDRLELSGGWGAGRLVLSVGLSFTNFS